MMNPLNSIKQVSVYQFNRAQLNIKILLNEIFEFHLMAIDIYMK